MTIATKNPAFALPHTDDLALDARHGIVAEFDMLTYSSGTVMTDVSGNGRNATFNVAPTVNAEGTVFGGGKYATFDLPAGLGDNYTFAVVAKANNGGYWLGGCHNVNDNIGSSLQAHPAAVKLISGNNANEAFIANASSSGTYAGYIAKVAPFEPGGLGRGCAMGSGPLGYRNCIRPSLLAEKDTRTKWAIGATFQTSGGNHDTIYNPLDTGTIAYFAVWNRAVDDEQDAQIYAWLKGVMAGRSITI